MTNIRYVQGVGDLPACLHHQAHAHAHPDQGAGDRQLPLPPRLHHHAHPLNGAGVSSGSMQSKSKVRSQTKIRNKLFEKE